MGFDYGATLAVVYATFGANATLTPVNGSPVVLSVIDETQGIEVVADKTNIPTIRPAACVRLSSLTSAGLARTDLRRASLVMSGKTWRIETTLPKPGLVGESDGEVILILIET